VHTAVHLVPEAAIPSHDPQVPASGFPSAEGDIGDNLWSFNLVVSYPRSRVNWAAGKQLRDIVGLQSGAQLVVELLEGAEERVGEKDDEANDDYDTEED